MQNPIYVGVSGQIALARRMEVIAMNMANINTPGFRGEALKFDSLVSQTATDNRDTVSFSSAGESFITTNRGPVTQTGNALDVAVKGDAYFSIQTPTGVSYTRDGRMIMTPEGGLVNVSGYPYLDNGGAPLQIDPQNGPPRISADGAIYQNNLQVGQIGVFQLQENSKLSYGMNQSIVPDKPPVPVVDDAVNGGVMQGYIENSNVNGVIEMTRLIEVSRAFEQVEAMLRTEEESNRNAIQTLGGKNQ